MRRKLARPKNLLRKERRSCILFTEGQTECGYFKQFKVRTKSVVGGNALRIVEEAMVQRQNLQRSYDNYWIVFDRDDTSNADFEKAILFAQKDGFNVAFSVEAFEIWWLFHFEKMEGRISRKSYARLLKYYMPEYTAHEKGEEQGRRIWFHLFAKLQVAITNAKEVHQQYDSTNSAYTNSVTSVYLLVESLIEDGFL